MGGILKINLNQIKHFPLCCTCGEHARVGVCGRETHVLLDATAGPFGRPLDGEVLRLLGYPPLWEAMVIDGLHSTVQGGLQGLQLGGGFPQQEAGHKLAQHRRTLILLQLKKRGQMFKQKGHNLCNVARG